MKARDNTFSVAFADDGMRANDIGVPIKTAFPQIDEKRLEELKLFVGKARMKLIADNRGVIAIRDRIGEYAKRAELLVKAAQAAQAKAFGNSDNNKKQIQDALDEAAKAATACASSLDHIGKKMKAIDVMLKSAKDARTAGALKGVIAERDEHAKGASGALKTGSKALELAKKIIADTPALQRSMRPAVQKADLLWMQQNSKLQQYKTKDFPAKDKEIAKAGIKL